MNDDTYPLIFVEGVPGTGKSSAIENLDPATTVIANYDKKPLPFKKKFPFKITMNSAEELVRLVKDFQTKDTYKTLIIDSFTAYLDKLLLKARAEQKNFDIWNYYNGQVGILLDLIVTTRKPIFLNMHTEITQTPDGDSRVTAKVKGKEWEGYLESKALIVLYTKVKNIEEGVNEYYFATQTDGKTAGKSPKGMFEDYLIPNDFQLVLDKIEAYYADDGQPEEPGNKLGVSAEDAAKGLVDLAKANYDSAPTDEEVAAEVAKEEPVSDPKAEIEGVFPTPRTYEQMSKTEKSEYLSRAKKHVDIAKNLTELTEVWNKFQDIQAIEAYTQYVKGKRIELEGKKGTVADLSDAEAEKITGGKIVEKKKDDPNHIQYPWQIDELIAEVDKADVTDSEALKEMYRKTKVVLKFESKDEKKRIQDYIKAKYERFSNGEKLK